MSLYLQYKAAKRRIELDPYRAADERITYSANGLPNDPSAPIVPLLEGQECLPDGTVVEIKKPWWDRL